MRLIGAHFRKRESATRDPYRWPVVIIRAGRSKNGPVYTREGLVRACESGIFERRPVNLFPVLDASGRPIAENHVESEGLVGRAPLNMVGRVENARWSEAEQAVVGDLVLLQGVREAEDLQERLVALERAGSLDALGLSIDGEGETGPGGVVSLRQINSVDVVTYPAAGGRVMQRLAASLGAPMDLLTILRQKHPRLAEGYSGPASSEILLARHIQRRAKESRDCLADLLDALKVKGWRDDSRYAEMVDPLALLDEAAMLLGILREHVVQAQAKALAGAGAGGDPAPEAPPAPPPAPVQEGQRAPVQTAHAGAQQTAELSRQLRDVNEQLRSMRTAESRRVLEAAAKRVGLTERATVALLEQHGGRELEAGEAERLVESQRALIDDAVNLRAAAPVRIVRESQAKLTEALAYMLAPVYAPKPKEGAPEHMSFQRFLEEHFLGRLRVRESIDGYQACRRLREAVDSTQFDQVFADALDRSVLATFQGQADYQVYQRLVRQVPYNDFRTHRVIHIGYYGTLPTVAKAGPYLALTTPSDREETIALAKKGGLEKITMEDLLNDDLQLWQTIIQRIGQAAAETRYESVMALIRDGTQPTMDDDNTLTSSARSPANEGALALTADATGLANLLTSIRGMAAATSGSGKKKGIIPRFLIIPLEKLQPAAHVLQELQAGNTGTDLRKALTILGAELPEVVIDLGTTNTTDWYLLADPMRAEVIRFATLGSRNAPEIILANDQRFGALFTNDQIELKVRDVHAAAAVDFTGIYGNDVDP